MTLIAMFAAGLAGCSSDLNLNDYTFACDSGSDCASGKVCDPDSKVCVLKPIGVSDADTVDTPETEPDIIVPGCADPSLLSAPVWKGDLTVSEVGANAVTVGWGPAIVDIACMHKMTYQACVQLTLDSGACDFNEVAGTGVTSAKLAGLLESRSYRIQMKACTAPDHCSDWSPVLTAFTQTSHATRAASVGEDHACAVLVDGTVRCWGNLNNNKLGNGKSGGWSTTPDTVISTGGQPLTGVVEVAAGANHTCARRADGSVHCWGVLNVGSPPEVKWSADRAVAITSLTDAIDIDAGQNHLCAVTADGKLYCWGDNVQGQLGHLPETLPNLYSIGPTQVLQLPLVQSVSAGTHHTCALTAGSGDVYCWGDNEQGQVGREKSTEAPFIRGPSLVGEGDAERKAVTAIAAGHFHTCGIRDDGTLWCWGSPGYKALGDLPQQVHQLPLVLDLEGVGWVDQLTAGFGFNCVRNSKYELECWGANGTAQSGSGTTSASKWPPHTLSFGDVPPAHITAGLSSACAVTHNGVNRCWGANNLGQLGYETVEDADGVPGHEPNPQTVHGLGAAQGAVSIAAAGDDTCAVLVDGQLRCWGGTGESLVAAVAMKVGPFPLSAMGIGLTSQVGCVELGGLGKPLDVCTGSTVQGFLDGLSPLASIPLDSLVSNEDVVCVLVDGEIKCQSLTNNPSTNGPLILNDIPEGRFVAVSMGDTYGCAVSSRGSVECWGDLTGMTEKPGTLRAKTLSVEGKRICAVADDGAVICWGEIEEEMTELLHVLHPSENRRVLSIRLQGKGYCLLFSDGTVECASDDADSILEVRASNAVALASGRAHACALLVDGSVYCWGDNAEGQSGCANPVNCAEPTALPLVF